MSATAGARDAPWPGRSSDISEKSAASARTCAAQSLKSQAKPCTKMSVGEPLPEVCTLMSPVAVDSLDIGLKPTPQIQAPLPGRPHQYGGESQTTGEVGPSSDEVLVGEVGCERRNGPTIVGGAEGESRIQ